MAEHAELVKEMVELEKLSSQERLKLAKKRRQQQLKKCAENEKKHDKQEKQAQKRKAKALSVITSSTASHHATKNHASYPPLNKPTEHKKKPRIQFDKGVMLLEAAARNDVNEVRALLEEGVNPDVANEDGLTALHQCCIDDSEDMLLLLLDYGANVNSRDSELWTPLHAASTCAHLRICQHLLKKSADLLAVNADGNMPYDICDDESTLEYIETEMASQGITQELIDETRDSTEKMMLEDIKEFEREGHSVSSWRDRTGATLLHVAAGNGYYDVTSYLLTKRFDVNVQDADNWTPAMAAACWGQIPVLELLAQNGADLEVKTKDNKTLVDLVDDVEVKEQISEIKREIKVNVDRFRRANSDVRRRSSNNIRSSSGASTGGPASHYNSNTSLTERNPFSSSVRRHSMREKHRLSMREARDEARYRISINTQDVDSSSAPTSPDDSSPPADAQKVDVPVTNIDDLDITVSDNNVTTINISEPATVAAAGASPAPSPPPDDSAVPPASPAKPKLVATISLSGEGDREEPEKQPSPKPSPRAAPRANVQPHMNGDRNSNDASITVGILKHSSNGENAGSNESATHQSDSKSADRSTFQQNTTTSSHSKPVVQRHDPPMRRYTAYSQPVGGKEKSSKNCCTIT